MQTTRKPLRHIADIHNADPNCVICKGFGWVCENHADVVWGTNKECCGGAGMPCTCNPLHSEHQLHPFKQ